MNFVMAAEANINNVNVKIGIWQEAMVFQKNN